MELHQWRKFIMDQRESHSFSKCECISPGFCPIFNRKMGTSPPDWAWCQRTRPEERKKYYELLFKAPPSPKKKFTDFIAEFKNEPQKLFLYYLTQNNKHHSCEIADRYQYQKNIDILAYFEKQKNKEPDFSNIEIACLGHSQKQFDTIPDRPYLKKINLNEIDAGKYSDNKWAEARAFVSSGLFSENVDFVGFVTASWNMKYEPFSLIENFHNWNYAKVLLNSKPEDKIVVCADIFCPCCWICQEKDKHGVLSSLFPNNYKRIGHELLKGLDLHDYNHTKVPFGNQMIMHKTLLSSYQKYLRDYDIFEKIDFFVNKMRNIHLPNSFKNAYYAQLSNKYSMSRLQAYLMEMVSCFWFSKQEFVYLPTTERRDCWYSQEKIEERIKWKK